MNCSIWVLIRWRNILISANFEMLDELFVTVFNMHFFTKVFHLKPPVVFNVPFLKVSKTFLRYMRGKQQFFVLYLKVTYKMESMGFFSLILFLWFTNKKRTFGKKINCNQKCHWKLYQLFYKCGIFHNF